MALNVSELKKLYYSKLYYICTNRVLANAKKNWVRRELFSVFLLSTGNVMWLWCSHLPLWRLRWCKRTFYGSSRPNRNGSAGGIKDSSWPASWIQYLPIKYKGTEEHALLLPEIVGSKIPRDTMLIAQGVNLQCVFLEVLSRAVTFEASFLKFNSSSMALSYQSDIIPISWMDGEVNPKKLWVQNADCSSLCRNLRASWKWLCIAWGLLLMSSSKALSTTEIFPHIPNIFHSLLLWITYWRIQ